MFIKHWRLNCLALVFIAIFFSLSYWQYHRAQQKENLLTTFKARMTNILNEKELLNKQDPLYYQVKLSGKFDNSKTILLDNKTYKGKIGYELYIPFHLALSGKTILVDRGFVPMGMNRYTKPDITYPLETQISGFINVPPHFSTKGNMINDDQLKPLIRVEYLDLKSLSRVVGHSLLPYVLKSSTSYDASMLPSQYLTTMTPEKHLGYAFQWFALGITLLVLLVALNLRKAS